MLGGLAAGLAAPARAQAQAVPAPACPSCPAQGAGFYRFRIGGMAAAMISDGYGFFPGWPFFGRDSKQADYHSVLSSHDLPTDRSANTANVLFVDTGLERVLIDTGYGGAAGPTFGHMRSNLAAAGVAASSVTLIVLSHAHVDHINGLLDADGALAFPNARLVMTEIEWAYWTSGDAERDLGTMPLPDALRARVVAAAARVLPRIAQRTERVPPGATIISGLHLVPAPGHTPGHSAVLIEDGDAQLLHMADSSLHPSLTLEHPDWQPAFDHRPALGVQTRRRLLDRAAADHTRVVSYHFPFPALGHIRPQGDGYRWEAEPWSWT